MNFSDLIRLCSVPSPDQKQEWAYLPLIRVAQTDVGRVALTVVDEEADEPAILIVKPNHQALLTPYLEDFRLYAQDPEHVDPPCIPVHRFEGVWVFSAAQALADVRNLFPEPDYEEMTPDQRPVRLQVTVTAESARRFTAKAQEQGMTRSQYLLSIVRQAVHS